MSVLLSRHREYSLLRNLVHLAAELSADRLLAVDLLGECARSLNGQDGMTALMLRETGTELLPPDEQRGVRLRGGRPSGKGGFSADVYERAPRLAPRETRPGGLVRPIEAPCGGRPPRAPPIARTQPADRAIDLGDARRADVVVPKLRVDDDAGRAERNNVGVLFVVSASQRRRLVESKTRIGVSTSL